MFAHLFILSREKDRTTDLVYFTDRSPTDTDSKHQQTTNDTSDSCLEPDMAKHIEQFCPFLQIKPSLDTRWIAPKVRSQWRIDGDERINFNLDPSRSADAHFRSPFAFWTLGVISVILSVLADAGNLINLFVLTRRHMRSTMTTLLVTLAWADLVSPTVVSLNNILFYYFLPHMNHSSTFLTTHMITRAVFNALANIFTTFSNWLIVLITTFRLIVVRVGEDSSYRKLQSLR